MEFLICIRPEDFCLELYLMAKKFLSVLVALYSGCVYIALLFVPAKFILTGFPLKPRSPFSSPVFRCIRSALRMCLFYSFVLNKADSSLL